MIKSLIGTKELYRRMFSLMLPIMVQNGITNFVNMLDNIMIGAIGTPEMTGVGIANQLFFVFNLCIFGAVSGAGIFGAQFFGNGDFKGVRYTFRFRIIFCTLLAVGGIVLFRFMGADLLDLYLRGEEGVTDPVTTMKFAKEYMAVMLIGLIPYSIVQCYSSTLREGDRPTLPMLAGIAAVAVNLALNYVLIFGKFGAPELGVRGAAIATVISRFVELAVIAAFTHADKEKYPFMVGAYKSLYVPISLVGQLFIKGLPLMVNETLWATGLAIVNQSYSYISLDAVAACNISQTFWSVVSIAYMAVGAAVGIILGQMLGANQLKEAKTSSYQMIAFSCTVATVIAVVYAIAAEFIPLAYNTEPEIRILATRIMQITAIAMPFDAIVHASYFALRSGGKMFITFIFDCGFMWCGNVLPAYLLARYTDISFLALFAIVHGVTVFKALMGARLVRSDFWLKNIVE